jgi:hypothetical protein
VLAPIGLLICVRDLASIDLAIYGRRAQDVRANGGLVLADLVGAPLDAAVLREAEDRG